MKNHCHLIFLLLCLQFPLTVFGQFGLEIFQSRWAGFYGYYFQPSTGYELSLSLKRDDWNERFGVSVGVIDMIPAQDDFPVITSSSRTANIISYQQVSIGGFGEFGILPHKFSGAFSPFWGLEAKLIEAFYDIQGFTTPNRVASSLNGLETGIKLGASLKLAEGSIWIQSGLGRNFVIVQNVLEDQYIDRAGYTSYWKPFVSVCLFVF
ncbi:MAG: hypothetical protein AAFW00_10320 [Bacteroidota bacterium]